VSGATAVSAIFLRFLIGGLVVAGIPLAAKYSGPYLAGLLVLVPATSALSIYFVGRAEGAAAVTQLTRGGLTGLLPLAVFFVTVAAATSRIPVSAAVGFGLAAWVATVTMVQLAAPPTWAAVSAAATFCFGATDKSHSPLRLVVPLTACLLTGFWLYTVGLLPMPPFYPFLFLSAVGIFVRDKHKRDQSSRGSDHRL
jgi:uncharacterized membrane protein (GlpM family)